MSDSKMRSIGINLKDHDRELSVGLLRKALDNPDIPDTALVYVEICGEDIDPDGDHYSASCTVFAATYEPDWSKGFHIYHGKCVRC